MKVRATTSHYIDNDGQRVAAFTCEHANSGVYTYADKVWRPLNDEMKWRLSQDVQVPADATEVRLVEAGDVYFAAVWELR